MSEITYTREETFKLMCEAFEQGYKKYEVIEAGLEAKDTKLECAWILTKHDSTPKDNNEKVN